GARLLDEGTDMLDVGGESTRPGAEPVDVDEELRRVIPVIEGLVKIAPEVPVSVDTRKPDVARAALEAGARIVNDITAGRDGPMFEAVAPSGAGIVLMHMLGEPRTMQDDPRYDDVVAEVAEALAAWAHAAEAAGVARDRVAVDPGIGFGKTLRHNLLLLAHLRRLGALGYPVLVG